MSNNIREETIEIAAELIPIRRHLHENPKIGLSCPNTKQFI